MPAADFALFRYETDPAGSPRVPRGAMVSLQRTLALLTPFVLVAMLHYMRFATFTPSGHENVAGRARAKYSAANFRRRMTSRAAAVGQQVAAAATSRAAAVGQQVAAAATSVASAAADAESAVASAATGATERVTTAWRGQGVGGGAMSSEAAVRRVLDQAGLKASDSEVHGLGEVTTAEAFHRALPPGEAVWLTFSNAAYLHFAQNWYMSVRAIGRQRQVVVAALDVPTLKAWRELKVPVLDYTHFGDSSDFRGIGADQARFRKMGAMKVAAFHQLLKLNRSAPHPTEHTAVAAPARTRSDTRALGSACSQPSSCRMSTRFGLPTRSRTCRVCTM